MAFCSRIYLENEVPYSPIHKECMAMAYGLRQFRPFIFLTKFDLFCDSKALSQLNKNTKDPYNMAGRLCLEIMEYTPDFKCIPASKNLVANALSRPKLIPSAPKLWLMAPDLDESNGSQHLSEVELFLWLGITSTEEFLQPQLDDP